jgi:hypothetical protein
MVTAKKLFGMYLKMLNVVLTFFACVYLHLKTLERSTFSPKITKLFAFSCSSYGTEIQRKHRQFVLQNVREGFPHSMVENTNVWIGLMFNLLKCGQSKEKV